jgi:hypothetical protein
MIIFLLMALMIIAASSFFAVHLIKRRKSLTWWDYSFPYAGIIVWFLLLIGGAGKTASLSNFVIEVFWIALVSIIMQWLVVGVSFTSHPASSILGRILTSLPIITSIIIRLTVETIPE